MRFLARIAALALALSCAPALAQDHPLLKKGDGLYKQFCAHCHGIGMVNPGTSSFDLRKFPVDQKERFVTSVTKGKGNMPAWGDILLPDELEALWVYVATRGGKEAFAEDAASAGPPPDPSAELLAQGELSACMPSNGGAMSRRRAGGGAGFDYAIIEAVAGKLDLALRPVWFEAEIEEESDPVREAYAVLAMNLCDVVPGHALYQPALGDPPGKRAAPPLWADRPATWVPGTFVDLVPISASQPYFRAEIGVAFGPGVEARPVRGLADLAGYRLAIQEDTLSGALLQLQAPQPVKAAAITRPPGPKFLWEMETGAFEAALVDVAAYDHHLIQNPVSKLKLGTWRHPLGFNIAVALRADRPALKAALDAALADLMAGGMPEKLAAQQHIHYAAPREPWVQPRLGLAELIAAR